MRLLSAAALLFALGGASACDSRDPVTDPMDAGPVVPCEERTPKVPVGGACACDGECGTGVCWGFSAQGRPCARPFCTSQCLNDVECKTIAYKTGATRPDYARCGMDGRCRIEGPGGDYQCN